MADITQTPANVRTTAASKFAYARAGEAISAGDLLYLNSTDAKVYKADSSTAVKAACVGMADNSAAADQWVRYATGPQQIGDDPANERVNPGGTVVVGETYFVSSNAGKFQPSGDVGSGEFVTKVGIGVTTSLIELFLHRSGIAHA